MAIDITTLSVQVKSKGIDDTAKSLDTLTKNAERAEQSVEKLEKRFAKSSTAIDAIKNSFMSMKDTMSKAFPTSGAVELNKALAQIAGTLNSINAKNIKINFGNVGSDAEVARKGVASLNRSLMEGHNVFQVVGKSLYSLRNLLGGTMLAAAMVEVTGNAIKMADSWALMGARLRLFSDSAEQAKVVQERLFYAAQDLRVPLESVTTLYTRLVPALKEYGLNADAALEVTKSMGAALKVSGATGAETASVMLQFSQAMAAGRLNGAEFNAVAEGAPIILRMLSKELGVSRGELKKMAAEGALTSGIISNVLSAYREELEAQSKEIPDTVESAIGNLTNALARYFGKLNESLGVTAGLSSVIKSLAENIDKLGKVVEFFAVVSLTALGLKLLAVVPQMLIMSTAAKGIAVEMGIAATATGVFSTALNFLSKHPVIIGLTALATAIYYGYQAFNDAENSAEDFNKSLAKSQAIDDKAAEFDRLSTKVESTEKAYYKAKSALEQLQDVQRRNTPAQNEANDFGFGETIAEKIARTSKEVDKLAASWNLAKKNLADYNAESKVQANNPNQGIIDQINLLNAEYNAGKKFTSTGKEIFNLEKNIAKLRAENIDGKLKAGNKNLQEMETRLAFLKNQEAAELRNAAKFDASKSAAKESESFAKKYAKQIEAINLFKDKLDEELSLKRKLTDAEKEALKIQAFITANKSSLSKVQLEELTSLKEIVIKKGEEIRVRKLVNDFLDDSQEKHLKLIDLQLQEADATYQSTKAIEDKIKVQELANKEISQSPLGTHLDQLDADKNRIKFLNEQIRLMGEELDLKIQLAWWSALENGDEAGMQRAEKAGKFIQERIDKYENEIKVIQKTIDANGKLTDAIDKGAKLKMFEIGRSPGQILADGFGEAGQAISKMTEAYKQFGDEATAINNYVADKQRLLESQGMSKADAKIAAEKDVADKRVQINAGMFASMAGAAKGFFSENSKGYQAMAKAEKAFRVIELAMATKNAIAKMALMGEELATFLFGETAKQGAEETTTVLSIAQSMARGTAKAMEAVASAFAAPFPVNFASGAAMIAIMAGLGFAIGGGGGSSAPSAADRQSTQGVGSVFGDTSAKSESLTKALDNISENSDISLKYNEGMLNALKNIEASLTGVSKLVIRSGIQGQLGTAGGTGYNKTTVSDLYEGVFGKSFGQAIGNKVQAILPGLNMIVGALFSVKKSVVDSGFVQNAQSFADVMNKGLDIFGYTDIETKKKRAGRTKTSTETNLQSLSDDLQNQFTNVVLGMGESIKEAAKVLQMDGGSFNDVLNSFVVDFGRISIQGMDGKQIQETLTNVFSKLGDDMVTAVMPGIIKFQDVGEGMLETLIRVASTVATVDGIFHSIGQTMNLTGEASIDAKMKLADLAGGLSELSSLIGNFYDKFYTDAEKQANSINLIREEFQKLNIPMIDLSKSNAKIKFREIVNALKETNQEAYISLLKLSDTVSEVITNMVEVSTDALNKAFDKLSKSIDKQKQVIKDAFDARVKILNTQKDAENESYKTQMDALKAQLDVAQKSKTALTNLFDSIQDAIDSLTGNNASASFASAKATLDSVLAIAQAGGNLPSADNFKPTLDVLKNIDQSMFASALDFQREKLTIAGKLTSLNSIVGTALTANKTDVLQSAIDALEDSHTTNVTAIDNQIKLLQSQYDADTAYFDSMLSNAKDMLDKATGTYEATLSLNESFASFNEAMSAYMESKSGDNISIGNESDLAGEISALRAELQAQNRAIAANTLETAKILKRWDGDGQPETRVV